METAIATTITFCVSTALGYCLNVIKNYRKKNKEEKENENLQNVALLTLLRNNLTNVYFVYSEMKQIPDYVYQNFLSMLEVYEKLGGDGFLHTIAEKMKEWEIVKTDILK